MEKINYYRPEDERLAGLFEKWEKQCIMIEGKMMIMHSIKLAQVTKRNWCFWKKGVKEVFTKVEAIYFLTYDQYGNHKYKVATDYFLHSPYGLSDEFMVEAHQKWEGYKKFLGSLGLVIVKEETFSNCLKKD